MLLLVSKLFISFSLILPSFQFTPDSNMDSVRIQRLTSKDEDLVKSACQLWWSLPEMKTTSPKDMQSWAKKVMPTVGKALSKATEAKKLNSKWSQFQLEMVTFYGSIYLGTDIKYSRIMFNSTVEKNALKYLSTTCYKRR